MTSRSFLCTRARVVVILVVVLLAGTYFTLGALFLRAEVFGHTALLVNHVSSSLTSTLYTGDTAPAARGCVRDFDAAKGFGPAGPRLWLWWTRESGATPGEQDAWMARECFASMLRHAAPLLTVAIVNSTETRDTLSPFFLRNFPLPDYFDALPVNHQGDFGSFALLAEFGGLYLDTDVFVLHSLTPWVRLLERFAFVGFGGHTFDEGVHHGLMASRPRAAILVRAYHASLAAYANEGGCAGRTCARVGELGWLTTLNAFAREAALLRLEKGPDTCEYARVPTRYYEPGLVEHQDLCTPEIETALGALKNTAIVANNAATAAISRLVVATMAAALSGTLRVLHLSVSKRIYVNRFDDWRTAPLMHCPLVGFLANVSSGAGLNDLAGVQRVGTDAIDVWEQHAGIYMP